jgi:hypothetical protein
MVVDPDPNWVQIERFYGYGTDQGLIKIRKLVGIKNLHLTAFELFKHKTYRYTRNSEKYFNTRNSRNILQLVQAWNKKWQKYVLQILRSG